MAYNVRLLGPSRRLWLVTLCSISCGMLTALAWQPPGIQLEFTPDSSEYEAIARNLHAGRGYIAKGSGIAANRSPAYPAVLAVLFDEREGVWHGRIIWLHRCLSFVIGASLVCLANELFGITGVACGVLASVLSIVDDTLAYAGAQLLTEHPATALLMLSLLAANWAVQGGPRRELLVAVLQIGLFMTRSAMIFCGIGYGIYLIYAAVFSNTRDGTRRVFYFGVPCTIAVLAWSVFLWNTTGQVILLTTTGLSNMAAGLSPEYVAATQGWPIPSNDRELEDFWTMAPAISTDEAMATLPIAASDPERTLRVTISKFKIAFSRMPIGAFFLAVCGIAVQFCSHLRERHCDYEFAAKKRVNIRQLIGQGAYFVAFCVCTLAVCGYSHTLTKAAVVVAALAIIVCRVSPTGRPFAARMAGESVPAILFMVCFGFVFMTLISFGIPRFTRPFLPPLYLSATLCVPLAIRLLDRHIFASASRSADSILVTAPTAVPSESLPKGSVQC